MLETSSVGKIIDWILPEALPTTSNKDQLECILMSLK